MIKFRKKVKHIFLLSICSLLLFACSKEAVTTDAETKDITVEVVKDKLTQEQENQIERLISEYNKEHINNKSTTVKAYHVLRYEVNNYAYHDYLLFKINFIANLLGGEILTKGETIECLERECSSNNLIIEFPSRDIGEFFFWIYDIFLENLGAVAFTNLQYTVSDEAAAPEFVFNEDINRGVYMLVDGILTDPNLFFTEYAPIAINSIAVMGGNVLAGDFTNTECKIGDCIGKSNVIVAFTSQEAFLNWYYSPVFQSVIPIRQASSVGGGFLYADAL